MRSSSAATFSEQRAPDSRPRLDQVTVTTSPMTSRPSTAAPILAVLAVVLVTLGAYFGGYFWFGKRMDYIGMSVPSRVEVIERRYAHSWLAIIYKPAAKVEE